MQLTGDPKGIEDFKEIKDQSRDYLKFLINEAKTNFGGATAFKSLDGAREYLLIFDQHAGELNIKAK